MKGVAACSAPISTLRLSQNQPITSWVGSPTTSHWKTAWSSQPYTAGRDGSALLLPSFTYRLTQGLELRGSCLKNVGDGELTLLPDQVRAVVVLRF